MGDISGGWGLAGVLSSGVCSGTAAEPGEARAFSQASIGVDGGSNECEGCESFPSREDEL